MKIDAIGISKGRSGHALPRCSVSMASGSARMVLAETAQRPTVLGLILSGRMRPDTGTLTLNGQEDRRRIRRRVALVDAPVVSEPHGDVTVAEVAAEELAFAGQRSHPIAVNRVLDELGLRAQANTAMADLAPVLRIRLLTELAARRPDIAGMVIVSPDRHGGEPEGWWGVALELAARGLAVMVIAGAAARSALDAGPTPAHRGETDELEPLPAALSGTGVEADEQLAPAEPDPEHDEAPSPDAEDPAGDGSDDNTDAEDSDSGSGSGSDSENANPPGTDTTPTDTTRTEDTRA
ncbi:hypothetical protein [Mycetocola reblochoni]|uniref:ABC transporter ATP-binding protein n=1 Tax=Mycetocola reblochoni REB411 TaxID=1255698 RepID=A0A1R4IN58_9MICO|nr:hypothetical protein [Mycetocola reblochoni]SJN21297.1 hypothetical protein FM119_02705 [Mycetocola reblochoni REB411]